ncbi:MAG TPA: hypothetical protein VGN14_09870 [Candidatus Elarobacter sp.]|jgi:hypothetical protein
MIAQLRTFAIAAGAAATIGTGAIIPRPASADTTSTLLTAAAAVGALVLYNNYQKRQQANNVVGYTQNGGTVYGDGRIVMPNGQTYYPNNNGQYAWGQQAYYQPNASGYQYDTQRTGRYDRTHRHGNAYGNRYHDNNGNHGNHGDNGDNGHGH